MIAEKWNITREELNSFSGASHEKAAEAIKKGKRVSSLHFTRGLPVNEPRHPIMLPGTSIFSSYLRTSWYFNR